MGKKPLRNGIWRATRRMVALAVVVALIVAPFVEILTHGPAAHAAAKSMATDVAEQIAVHGHTHEDAGHDHRSGPFGGHNPTDHDHQLLALVCHAVDAPRPYPGKAQCAFREVFRQLTREGPRRPPRPV